MNDDLVAFLKARLADDEADPGGWPAARVRAEVDAKRRILARYTSAVEDSAEDADGYYDENRFEDARQLRPVLRLLALPYRGHPDYRPEWAPES
jgi:hypothetical protein